MRIHELRAYLTELSEEVDEKLQVYRDRGLTEEEIALADPFLMGQAWTIFRLGVKMMGPSRNEDALV